MKKTTKIFIRRKEKLGSFKYNSIITPDWNILLCFYFFLSIIFLFYHSKKYMYISVWCVNVNVLSSGEFTMPKWLCGSVIPAGGIMYKSADVGDCKLRNISGTRQRHNNRTITISNARNTNIITMLSDPSRVSRYFAQQASYIRYERLCVEHVEVPPIELSSVLHV